MAQRILILLAVSCGACASDRPAATKQQADVLHAGALFVSRAPYRAMCVEIDSVQGTHLSDSTIASMRDFLQRYCDKPDGITIRCDPPIPREQADSPENILALRYGSGPSIDAPQPAYLHIVVYDSRQRTPPGPARSPRFMSNPYPAIIYIDRAYESHFQPDIETQIILHELGHAIGLVANPAHGDAVHCTNRGCLMNPSIDVSITKSLLRMKHLAANHDLCDQCKADLRDAAAAPANPRNAFVGACFVRREAGYWVASLPGVVYVSFDPIRSVDSRQISEIGAQHLQGNRNPDYIYCKASAPESLSPELMAAIQRAESDPVPIVRQAATLMKQTKLQSQTDLVPLN